MKTKAKREQKTFTIESLFINIAVVGCLVLLTIYGAVGPGYDVIDTWMDSIHNQVKLTFILMFIGLLLAAYMVFKKLGER